MTYKSGVEGHLVGRVSIWLISGLAVKSKVKSQPSPSLRVVADLVTSRLTGLLSWLNPLNEDWRVQLDLPTEVGHR